MGKYNDFLSYDLPIVDLEQNDNEEVGIAVNVNIFKYC